MDRFFITDFACQRPNLEFKHVLCTFMQFHACFEQFHAISCMFNALLCNKVHVWSTFVPFNACFEHFCASSWFMIVFGALMQFHNSKGACGAARPTPTTNAPRPAGAIVRATEATIKKSAATIHRIITSLCSSSSCIYYPSNVLTITTPTPLVHAWTHRWATFLLPCRKFTMYIVEKAN